MTRLEAKRIIEDYDFSFLIEDASFGDGSVQLNYEWLINSKSDAEKLKEAMESILNDIKNDPDYGLESVKPESTKQFEQAGSIDFDEKGDEWIFKFLGKEMHRSKSKFQCKIKQKELQEELGL